MILLSDYNALCEKFNIPKISLDFYSDAYNCVPSKQMDHARYLEVSLTEYGVFRPMQEGEEARIRLLKPDQTYVYNDCAILENGRLLVTLTDTILSYKGKARFDIVVNQPHHPAGEKGHVYSTRLAYLDIAPTPYSNEVIESSNEFGALLNAIDRVEEINHQAEASAETASQKAAEARDSADQAGESALHAAASASGANESATQASASAALAAASEANAKSSETNAEAKASEAENHANLAKSYACGDTGIRPNENIDNAKYYYEQSRTISESIAGALRPMGTVVFADLPALSDASEGDMYNVADPFVTTADFKEGSGNEIPAGANIYKTSDGNWDVLAGSPVAGVKGNAEDTYRTGNVSISPEDIGAVSCDGGTEDNTVAFVSKDAADPGTWAEVPVLEDGEKHRSLFGKISTMFRNVRYLYKVLGNADISGIGNGTATGAIRQLNTDLGGYLPLSGGTIKGPFYIQGLTSDDNGYITDSTLSIHIGNDGLIYFRIKIHDINLPTGFQQVFSIAENGVRLKKDTYMYDGKATVYLSENNQRRISVFNSNGGNTSHANLCVRDLVDNRMIARFRNWNKSTLLGGDGNFSYWVFTPGVPGTSSAEIEMNEPDGTYRWKWMISPHNSSGVYDIQLKKDNTIVQDIYSSNGTSWYMNFKGNIAAIKYDTSSSILVKENICNLSATYAENIIFLRPVIFDFIESQGGAKNQIGLIAEEVEEYFPEVVSTPDDIDVEKGHVKSIDYSKLVTPLIKMVQLQQEKINMQERRIQNIEDKIENLLKTMVDL